MASALNRRHHRFTGKRLFQLLNSIWNRGLKILLRWIGVHSIAVGNLLERRDHIMIELVDATIFAFSKFRTAASKAAFAPL
jgi:hypothetical protein